MQKRDRRTREERALRRAAVLLRLTVLLWIAVLLLCLLEPGCLAMDAAAAAAECGSEAGVSSAEVSAEDMRAAASGAAASEAAVPVRNGEKQKSGGQVSNLVRSSVLINVFNNENEPFR